MYIYIIAQTKDITNKKEITTLFYLSLSQNVNFCIPDQKSQDRRLSGYVSKFVGLPTFNLPVVVAISFMRVTALLIYT